MAYGNGSNQQRQFGNTKQPLQGKAPTAGTGGTAGAGKTSANEIFRSGLFAADPENEISQKVGEVASVKVRETVTIPAGSYISLRTSKSEKVAFNLVVKPGKSK